MPLQSSRRRFPTPDGRPVHCVVLLATPPGEENRHLQILGTLARTVGSDAVIQTQLFNAQTPAHAYEILNNEEAEVLGDFGFARGTYSSLLVPKAGGENIPIDGGVISR